MDGRVSISMYTNVDEARCTCSLFIHNDCIWTSMQYSSFKSNVHRPQIKLEDIQPAKAKCCLKIKIGTKANTTLSC